MKIGIDIRSLMDVRYSGVSEFTLNLVRELVVQGKNHQFKLFYNSAKDISNRMPAFTYPNVEIIAKRYPNKLFNYLLQKILHYPKIDRLLDVDIFLMPHFNLASISNDSKLVLVVHDLSFVNYPEFFSSRKNFWHKSLGSRKLIKRADKIIAISENTKADLLACGLPAEKIETIMSAASSAFKVIDPENEEMLRVKQKYGLHRKFVLYLGTVEPRKNVDTAIRAYDLLKSGPLAEYDMVIAGGRGWCSNHIYDQYENSKYKDSIKFIGYVEREDKPCLYNLADVMIFPSYYEGFGLPPLEAICCGTPVIASNVSSLPEVIADSGILINPYDVNDLANSIRVLITDFDLRTKLKSKTANRCKEFDWSSVAKKYLDIIESFEIK